MESHVITSELNEQVLQLVQSCQSLSKYDEMRFKVFVPQIFAAIIAMLYSMVIGIGFGYSAILIPQLVDAQLKSNASNDTTQIMVSETEISWIASVLPTAVLPASFLGGIMIDTLGRLNTLKISVIPNAVGWILIATAYNVPMLIAGRFLTGTAVALGVSPAVVYVTEISSPAIRGALVAISPSLVSLGMMLAYLEGWFFHWRVVAWISLVYIIVPFIFIVLWLPESPTWLVSKNRIQEARKSLEWLNKYRTDSNNEHAYTELQLSLLQKEHLLKQGTSDKTESGACNKVKMFAEPTVHKPLLILTVLYFFQQFSGLFIMLFYTVSFFKEVGTDISAYLAAVLVGAVRFGMSIVAIFLMKRFSRRPLIMLSAFGMCVSIGLSGLFTQLIKEEKTILNWIPVTMILVYVASSMIGFLGIPWTIISELFPTSVRGIAHSISFGIAHVLMFATIQLYFSMTRFFGGLAGLQYFFAAISLGGVVYSYIFLPETHNKKLPEIQEHFKSNWTYFLVKRTNSSVDKR